MIRRIVLFAVLFIPIAVVQAQYAPAITCLPNSDAIIAAGPHHTQHFTLLHGGVPPFNAVILKAVDTVQSHEPEGGTYFIGIKAVPPESPLTYPITLGDKPLLQPARRSSYCSGATYGVFIETLNALYPYIADSISYERFEAMRMQEPDGGRREDGVKFWGRWNADGNGCKFALVDYAKMGKEIAAEEALPGDFANISWKSGNGHSVVFLGWYYNSKEEKAILYWSSQKGTNGYGDQLSALSTIAQISFVRLTHPENVFGFNQ